VAGERQARANFAVFQHGSRIVALPQEVPGRAF
jgi:hypothetical protein